MAKIYLSSTFSDLIEHRKAVYDALRRMRHDVIAMEHYVSTDERPLDKCLKDVADCDIYIGIFAWRYGFIPTKDNSSQKSITELEYRKACELGKPCLIFLLAEDVPWPLTLVDMHTREGKRGRYIKALRKELAQEKTVNHFHNSEELATLASTAVTNHLKETVQGAIDTSLMMRLSYLESIYEHYKSVKLPIGPADGLSLLAIFQPLKLRNDPLAAEDLEREKRRKLLGESLTENDEHSLGTSLQTVTAENAEEALVKSAQKRIVILGGPGAGKTTTLKHLIASVAKTSLDIPENTDLSLPIFISLPDLARTNMGLQGYLPHILDELKVDVSFTNDLWQAINTGRAFICLDSLDEVDPRLRNDVIERINTWTYDARNIWIVGSRFTEYKGGQFRRGQFSEWELQPMDAPMRRELAQRLLPHLQDHLAEKHYNVVTPAAFAELLEKHPQAAAWGENPLLFSLAAIVFVKTGDLPSSRAALYREIIEAVLRMREHDATERELLLRTFTKLALWLHEKKGRTFTRRDLVNFLEDVQQRPWNDTIRIGNRIVKSGVIEVVAHDTYGFRHQTFQEYLAAVELARRLTHLDLTVKKEAWNVIWSKRTYSRWAEILSLLVGVLIQQQGPEGKRQTQRWLCALIEQREGAEGDPGGLGLLLVLKSLSEVMRPENEMPTHMEELAEKIVLIWVEELLSAARSRRHIKANRISMLAYEISHFSDRIQKVALNKLIEALGDTSQDVREWVILTLRLRKELVPSLDLIRVLACDKRLYVSEAAIEVLGLFGDRLPIDELMKILDDIHEERRRAAVRALGRQGERMPVEALVRTLHDKSWSVRQAAVGALGAHKEHVPIEALIGMLDDRIGAVREAAVRILGRQEERVSIETLVKGLCDAEWSVRRAAVEELGKRGERAPVGEIMRMLHDADWRVRRTAVNALKGQGKRVPIEELVRMLHDVDEAVRREAVEVLGGQGERAPIEEMEKMLQDAAGSVCGVTMAALEALGKRVAMEEMFGMLEGKCIFMCETAARVFVEQESVPIEDLMNMLHDNNWVVRRTALEALRAQEERVPIEELMKLLHNGDEAVRWTTVEALGVLGKRVPIEELARMLHDNDWVMSRAAVEALGAQGERVPIEELMRILHDVNTDIRRDALVALGVKGANVPIVELVGMLHDNKWHVRYTTLEALAAQGERTPIEELVRMLHDNVWYVRRVAVEALAVQGERAPIEELVGMLHDDEWHVRSTAVEALAAQGERTPIEKLVGMLHDDEWHVRSTAVEALAAQGEQGPIEELVGMLHDDVWYVRQVAVKVLGEQGERVPIEELVRMLFDAEWNVRQETVNALSKMKQWASLEELMKMLYDERVCMRWAAVRSLETRGESVPIEELVRMLYDEEVDVRQSAVKTLGTQGERAPIEELVRMLYDEQWKVRLATVRALGMRNIHVPPETVVATLGDEKKYVHEASIDVLKKIAPQALAAVASEATAILRGEPTGTVLSSIQQYFIIDVISNMGKVPPSLLEKLTSLLDWPYWLVRLRTIQALRKIRRNIPDTAIKRLLEIRLDSDLQVIREAADDALAEILSLEAGIEDD